MFIKLQDVIKSRAKELDDRERELNRLQQEFDRIYPCAGKPGDVLRLNVGGTIIDVLRRTLTSAEGSMLAAKFSGRWDESLERDKDGNFFIDQDIDLFLPLVNYLRARSCFITGAPVVTSPRPSDDFLRMVQYYGALLFVYPFKVLEFGCFNNKIEVDHNLVIETDAWKSFRIVPDAGNDCTRIISFEALLGKATSVQVGWIQDELSDEKIEADSRGVGYVENSIAFDCVRCGVAYNDSRVCDFLGLENVSALGESTVIRCENFGTEWYVNDRLVASSKGGDGVSKISASYNAEKYSKSLIPCVSVQGQVKISSLKLVAS